MRLLTLAASAAALLLASQAHAATWMLNYSSNDAPKSALLKVTASDTQNLVGGGFDVTGITGWVGAEKVTGLIGNANPSMSYSDDGLFIFDNVIFDGARAVSWGGLFFGTNLGNEYNLFSDSDTTFELFGAKDRAYGAHSWGTLTATKLGGENPFSNAVPEPAAWTMMILGFGGIGAMLRRRKQALVSA